MTPLTAIPILSVLPENAPVHVRREANEICIDIPKACRASLIESYESQGPEAYATQATLRVSLAEGARLTHYKVVCEGAKADHYSFLEAHVDRSASYQSHVFLLEGSRIRNTLHVRLEGEGAECSLNGLYLGTGEQIIETHTLIDHAKPHGTSREFYKGILDQKAQGLFDGLIVVQKEAQKTDSAQANKNLLLSSAAKARSNPELKILANDVKCKHGSTIGQIDPNQLFYLRARGIPREEARRLLVDAFAREMIQLVEIASLRASLEKLALAKFQS